MGERPVLSGTLRRLEIAGARMWSVHAVLVDTDWPDGQHDGVIPVLGSQPSMSTAMRASSGSLNTARLSLSRKLIRKWDCDRCADRQMALGCAVLQDAVDRHASV